MKLNHLVPKYDANQKCDKHDPTSKTHYWLPSGRIEATVSNLVSVDFACKYCNKRTTNFLTEEQFKTNKILLENQYVPNNPS
jgi:hypothetical protein